GSEPQVSFGRARDISPRGLATSHLEAPDIDTRENVLSHLSDETFFAGVAMGNKIADFAKSGAAPGLVPLAEEQAIQIPGSKIASHQPSSAVTQIFIEHD